MLCVYLAIKTIRVFNIRAMLMKAGLDFILKD